MFGEEQKGSGATQPSPASSPPSRAFSPSAALTLLLLRTRKDHAINYKGKFLVSREAWDRTAQGHEEVQWQVMQVPWLLASEGKQREWQNPSNL